MTDLSDVEGQLRLALYPAPDGTVGSDEPVGGGLVVTGMGLSAQTDLSGVSLGGQPLAACVDEDAVDCLDADGLPRVRGTSITLEVDGATITLTGDVERTITLGVGGEAFGTLAAPTVVTDLDPDITPPCLVE